jgi:hypothetical protein
VETIYKFPHQRPEPNRGFILLYITSVASGRGPILREAAKREPGKEPRSSPIAEAKTPFPKLPFAQGCSRTGVVLAYFALFANPVKTIFQHLKFSFGSR